jgi:hypothetical protein
MAKRDPNKTARNRAIDAMKMQLRRILPDVLLETGFRGEASLNAFIGGKTGEFINLKEEVIKSPEEFVSKWVQGLQKKLRNFSEFRHRRIHENLKDKSKPKFREYTELFLKRSFLIHYEELSKQRPRENETEYWFGVNDAHYGLFITPRFSKGKWENDRSEIRAFPQKYWTIGHVLLTGLCIPGNNQKYSFTQIDDLLHFFIAQVRLTKSTYQLKIAEKYVELVRQSQNPNEIPFLIPEMRYGEDGRKHEHRLDFLIINPFTMDKIGFEISPWSTHGEFVGKDKNIKELNAEARANFESEMEKIRKYFKKFNVHIYVYTDKNLANLDGIFDEMKIFLSPEKPPTQLSFNLVKEYFG